MTHVRLIRIVYNVRVEDHEVPIVRRKNWIQHIGYIVRQLGSDVTNPEDDVANTIRAIVGEGRGVCDCDMARLSCEVFLDTFDDFVERFDGLDGKLGVNLLAAQKQAVV